MEITKNLSPLMLFGNQVQKVYTKFKFFVFIFTIFQIDI